jgi:DNA-binding NarL/FixJ family response regulator
MTIQILIVDDRAVVRKELRNVLDLSGTITIVGEAAGGQEAIMKAVALKPDIVLMDLEMPGLDGFEATRQIKALQLARKVIAFTVYADAHHEQKAKEAGADAFVVKGTDVCTLLDLFEKLVNQPDRSHELQEGENDLTRGINA